jgi:hypothetical protein
MAHVLEGKSIGLDQKTVLEGELLIWRTKNQVGTKVQSNSRIQNLNPKPILSLDVNPTLRSTFFSFPILKHQKETKIH